MHHCGPASIPVPDAISGLSTCDGSLLCSDGFSPGSPVFLPHKNPDIQLILAGCKVIHQRYNGSQRRPLVCFWFDLVGLRHCCTCDGD